MIRFLLLSILLTLVARTFWKMIDGAIEGYTGQPRSRGSSGVPARGVRMAQDPVCGTFVVPAAALSISEPAGPVYFCSIACRDQYRARPSTSSSRPERVEGRTA